MKSDREFLDGIYQKAEKLDPVKTISQEESILLTFQKKRKNSYFSSSALKLSGSFAALMLVFALQGIQTQKEVPPNPSDVPRVISRSIEITREHPLFHEATDVIEVEAVKNGSLIELTLLEAFRFSKENTALEGFLKENELGIEEGTRAVLFLQGTDGGIKVLDVFYYEKASASYLNAYRESFTGELLEEMNENK